MKSVLIDEEVHKRLKEVSKKSGIKMKVIVETGIMYYISHIKFNDVLDNKLGGKE